MLNILLIIVLAGVLLVLLTGVFVMARGGKFDRKFSNKLMRYRVAVQFIALILIGIILYLRG